MHQTIPTIHRLLSPPGATPLDQLAARAASNARLIRALALTNTFVSADPSIHAAFVGRATSFLRLSTGRGWPQFQQVAIDAVDAALLDVDQMDFDTFIQDVTMRVALLGLLGVDASVRELDSRDIRFVATHITLLWSLSKKSDPIPPNLLPQLNHHLRLLLPDVEAFPNPLDYLIPVWETLWRVVATTVAYAHRHSLEGDVFEAFHNLPTSAQFRAFCGERPSVEAIVAEAMRLHPPSRHISRTSLVTHPITSFLPSLIVKIIKPTPRQECADIGTVLRSESIWGEDADIFKPLRYHPNRVTREQEKIKWLAFGHGRYRCVATGWAPMAAGLISASILSRLETGSGRRLVEGEFIGTREGWKGWTICKCAPAST
ncbi:putative cytochrome P450 [Lyophyllum shimeji]|uniref:Cytochrome P450 n=1 Tax=Lyophyllum shimeji TaxID=47721 RepID=A0A9P3PHJ3_LYOSH|nr:putative cytochrome P450 [Lyophyllum shimeji]